MLLRFFALRFDFAFATYYTYCFHFVYFLDYFLRVAISSCHAADIAFLQFIFAFLSSPYITFDFFLFAMLAMLLFCCHCSLLIMLYASDAAADCLLMMPWFSLIISFLSFAFAISLFLLFFMSWFSFFHIHTTHVIDSHSHTMVTMNTGHIVTIPRIHTMTTVH